MVAEPGSLPRTVVPSRTLLQLRHDLLLGRDSDCPGIRCSATIRRDSFSTGQYSGSRFQILRISLVTASFYFPYYLAFLGLAMVVGRSLITVIQHRAIQVLGALLPGGHVHDVYLTPPYQHVWFSSNDREYNPLGKDPKMLNDDELLVSFKKLYDTVEPGGSLSIILPEWAGSLGDRFEKLMPATGFEA